MKIAFVYDAVYPWVKGGAEMRIHELGKRLSARGHEVHLFGIKWWEGKDIFEYEGMTLHGVCRKRELYVAGRRSISEALVFSVKLFPHLLREKFDIIDVSVFPYFSCFTVKIASMMKNTPSVFTWHEVWGDYWYEYLGRAGFFGKLVEKAVSKISGKNIAVSAWTKKRLEALGVPKEKISVVPNGIDLGRISKIDPEGGRICGGLEGKKYDAIFAGRLIKEKNVDVLIKAIALSKANFPNIKCCIVGDGPEREVLVRLSDELDIRKNVDFVGFQEHETLIAKLKASRVLVLPSSREGFGMVVIEAFACRVPVITVKEKYNAAQGLVENGIDGLVVELEDREISESIEKLIVDDSNYKKMSEAALQKAKKYDWDEIVTQLENCYEDLA